MSSQQQQKTSTSSTDAHPATVDDINRSKMTQTSPPIYGGHSSNTGLWIKKPDNKDNTISAVSSTTSEYGSSQGSRHSVHASDRPIADSDAFIQPDEINKHWQSKMTPAERAKQLAAEMDQAFGVRTKSSTKKTLKFGGTKIIKRN